jgi:hypothetical protein
LALFFEENAVSGISATSAREIHAPVASSRIASGYSIFVHASSAIVAMAFVTTGVHAHRDRHVGTSGARCTQGIGAIERRVRAQQNPRRPARRVPVAGPRSGQRVSDQPRRAAGRPHDPFRSRCATITGAAAPALTVASSALSPRTRG